jgi:endonuclease/exonuclease/phosphatase family metal-dependent hydrolase
MDQAQRIATKIHEQREKYGSPPTLLVGDTNQFCIGHDKEAIRYLKGENGLSPVVFVDATFLDKGMSFDGGCRVDFILASINQWSWVQSSIDRKGMGSHGNASDHAALMAELVPLF